MWLRFQVPNPTPAHYFERQIPYREEQLAKLFIWASCEVFLFCISEQNITSEPGEHAVIKVARM